MPIKNDPTAVRNKIQHALSNGILGRSEAKRLLRSIKKDGVTKEEVKVVVDELKTALAGGPDKLDTSSYSRKKTLNRFLGSLHNEQPLPLNGAPSSGSGASRTVNWIELMTMHNSDNPIGPTDPVTPTDPTTPTVPVTPTDPVTPTVPATPTEPVTTTALSHKGFSGQEVSVQSDGKLILNGQELSLDADIPSAETNGALLTLNKPAQTSNLPKETQQALSSSLSDVLSKHNQVGNEDKGKFKKLVAANAAAGAMSDMAENWDATTIDKALETAKDAKTPLMKSLLLRGLDKAALSPEQKQMRTEIEGPENAELLLKSFDDMRSGQAKAGWTNIRGEAAEFGLSALTFAKSEKAIGNVLEGMETWKDLNSNHQKPWDGEEISNMSNVLETYVNKYPQTAYQYGTFSHDAPKEIAKITNKRVIAEVGPQLEENPPNMNGFPLSENQAKYVKDLLPNIKDSTAAKKLVDSLHQANAIFSEQLPSSWRSPANPEQPMSKAAFELFQKASTNYQDSVGASPDGKLDYKGFLTSFKSQVKDLHGTLKPRMAELNGNPPSWQGTEVSTEAASYVKQQLSDHLKSTMSIDNIGRAIKVVAEANGGKLEGAGLNQLQTIVSDYKSNWPDAQTFDFNKLERIASYKVQGKEVPLCTINGQQVGLADFYDKIGTDVSNSIDKTNLRHNWMADRWGYRAKESIELLDVVAEQTARGEGPVAELRDRHPGAKIEIQASGRDGAHEQFIYTVKNGSRTVASYGQSSDGTLSRYTGRQTPILFTATVGKEGELDVKVPSNNSIHNYPLQSNYGVGDKIDMHWEDPNAVEGQEEGKMFTTSSRVLEAEITGYSADGKYDVKFTTPDGTEKTKTLSMRDIRRANNPHYFKSKSSYFSDTLINLQTDKELKGFLEEAQPIIDTYLPSDGSLATISSKELARRQKDCIKALMDFTSERVKYPASKDSSHIDDESKKYHELDAGRMRFPLGDLVKIGKGVCRHQCILEHLLLQQAGIESRLASGSANASSGNFRGYHIWTEVSLADGERYLSDQTWNDPTVPLWDGAYDTDKRRTEMYRRTARYDGNIEMNN